MIVADTGAMVALMDASTGQHALLARIFAKTSPEWVLPWAILPEVDYLLEEHVGARVADAFLKDVSSGAYSIEWGRPADVRRAEEICRRYRDLRLGLVDSVVMAVAERAGAEAIATLDLRHFSAVKLKRPVKLYPRDF